MRELVLLCYKHSKWTQEAIDRMVMSRRPDQAYSVNVAHPTELVGPLNEHEHMRKMPTLCSVCDETKEITTMAAGIEEIRDITMFGFGEGELPVDIIACPNCGTEFAVCTDSNMRVTAGKCPNCLLPWEKKVVFHDEGTAMP